VKKKTAKIEKERARPKIGQAEVDALVRELSKPERIAREAEKLIRGVRSDPRLRSLRFAPEALVAAVAEHGAAEKPVEAITNALATPEMLESVRRTLDAVAKSAGKLEEILPFRVGVHMLDAAGEKGRPPAQNPLWSAILSATAYDLPIALYVATRGVADLEKEAILGRAASSFQTFYEADERLRAMRKALPGIELETVLIHAQLGFEEAHEIALPLEAALMGPIEAAKASRRRMTLAGIGAPAANDAEQAKILSLAIERDKERAVPAYRRELTQRLQEAARDAAAPATKEAGLRRFASLWAMLATLELLPPTKNIPLIAAYEQAAPRAIDEASPEDQPLVKGVLFKPLDPAPYRALGRRLLETDKGRARAFAEAALAAFPGDAELESVRAAGA